MIMLVLQRLEKPVGEGLEELKPLLLLVSFFLHLVFAIASIPVFFILILCEDVYY